MARKQAIYLCLTLGLVELGTAHRTPLSIVGGEMDMVSPLPPVSPMAQSARHMRTIIDVSVVALWVACLVGFLAPRSAGSTQKTQADNEAPVKGEDLVRLQPWSLDGRRVFFGAMLVVVSLPYLCSISSVRHAVTRLSAVQSVLLPSIHHHDEWVMSKIGASLPPKGSRILNFGCGLNTLSDELVSRGYDVVPLDIQDESIAKTPVVVYDGAHIPPELGQFDAAIISTVLHHIPDEYIPHILQELGKHTDRIVILEDVARAGPHNTFVQVALSCMEYNLLFFNHPLNFKTHEDWRQEFEHATFHVTSEDDTDNAFSIFVLEPKKQGPV